MSTDSSQKLEADVDTISLGGVDVGVAITDTKNAISNTVALGGTITAGNIDVNAHQATSESLSTAYAVAGALVGASGAEANAETTGTIQAVLNDNAKITLTGDGVLNLKADGDTITQTRADGYNGGLVAGGGTHPTSTTDITRLVKGRNANISAEEGIVNISAGGTDSIWNISRLGSGGLLDGAGAESDADAKSTTKIELTNAVITAKTLNIDAAHTTRQRSFDYTGAGSIVGGIGNYIDNKTEDVSTVLLDGGTYTSLDTDIRSKSIFRNEYTSDDIDKITLLDDDDRDGLKEDWADSTYSLDTDSGSAVDINNSFKWELSFDSQVNIQDNTVFKLLTSTVGQGTFNVSANNDVVYDEKIKGVNGGAVAAMLVTNKTILDKANAAVNIGNAKILTYGDAVLDATADIKIHTQTDASSYGAGAGVNADTHLTAKDGNGISHTVSFANGANLTANSVTVKAHASKLDLYALTQTWNKGAVTGNSSDTPEVSYKLNNRININTGSEITTFSYADLGVSDDNVSVSGRLWEERLNTWDAIKGIFTGDFTTVTTKDSDVDNKNDTSLYIDGTITAGEGNEKTVTIASDGSVTYSTITFDSQNKPKDVAVTENVSSDGSYIEQVPFDLYTYYQTQINSYQTAINNIGDSDPTGALKAKYEDMIAELKSDAQKTGVMDADGNKIGDGFVNVLSLPAISLKPSGVILRANKIDNGSNAKISINDDAAITVENSYGESLMINGLSIIPDTGVTSPLSVIGEGEYKGAVEIKTSGGSNAISVKNSQNSGLAGTGESIPTHILVVGDILSPEGTVTLTNVTGGDINVDNGATITADTITINAGTGNVSLDEKNGSTYEGFAPVYSLTKANVTTPSVISGANVSIKGWALNINGTVNAGISRYQLTIPSNPTLLADGQEITIAQAGTTGKYALKLSSSDNVNATYNAETGQFEIDDIIVKGGLLELEGGILNAGEGGELNVMDGYASVNVNNQSGHDVVINSIDVGDGTEGVIKITDYSVKHAQAEVLLPSVS